MTMDANVFLRRVLQIDAATCLATGLGLTLGASLAADITGLPAALLRGAGLVLLPFGAFIAWVSTRARLHRTWVWAIVAANIGWVIGSVLLIAGGFTAPTGLGVAFVLAQALAVGVLAELEIIGLRRLPSPAMA